MGDIDELYDMEEDPFELDNLICEQQYEEIIRDMKERLLKCSFETEDTLRVSFEDINTII